MGGFAPSSRGDPVHALATLARRGHRGRRAAATAFTRLHPASAAGLRPRASTRTRAAVLLRVAARTILARRRSREADDLRAADDPRVCCGRRGCGAGFAACLAAIPRRGPSPRAAGHTAAALARLPLAGASHPLTIAGLPTSLLRPSHTAFPRLVLRHGPRPSRLPRPRPSPRASRGGRSSRAGCLRGDCCWRRGAGAGPGLFLSAEPAEEAAEEALAGASRRRRLRRAGCIDAAERPLPEPVGASKPSARVARA
jgi:hypothetical protein